MTEKENEKESCGECEDGIIDNLCCACHGSGEGMYDGSKCYSCNGKGNQIEYCSCERGDERLSEEIF